MKTRRTPARFQIRSREVAKQGAELCAGALSRCVPWRGLGLLRKFTQS
jgi:hypothetical protein